VVELAEGIDRDRIFSGIREAGVGVNVHYVPVHLHPYYRRELGTREGDCPVTERAYTRILSLPMYPGLTDDDVDTVVGTLASVLDQHG
jgi:perosamine synthetase